MECVPRQRCVVRLNVHAEIFVESVLTQEADRGCRVEVILMLHGFFRFRLDVEIACEADLASIVTRHAEQLGDIVLLELHIGVEQCLIALTSTPEYIALCTELDGELNPLLCLCGSKAEDVGGVTAARAVHKARIAEHICCCPECLDARALGLFEKVVRHLIEAAVRLIDIRRIFGHHVRIVETVVFDAELLHELNAGVYFRFRVFDRTWLRVEGFVCCPCTKHVYARCTEIVPPRHRETQMIFHRLAENHALCVVILECKLIFAVSALEWNLRDVWKNFTHDPAPFLLN